MRIFFDYQFSIKGKGLLLAKPVTMTSDSSKKKKNWPPIKIVNTILSILGVIFALLSFKLLDKYSNYKIQILAVWYLVPPICFFIEWILFDEEDFEMDFEQFKYSQKTARDIWLAVAALLALMYFKT